MVYGNNLSENTNNYKSSISSTRNIGHILIWISSIGILITLCISNSNSLNPEVVNFEILFSKLFAIVICSASFISGIILYVAGRKEDLEKG